MSTRSPITTHVLDLTLGKPAEGITVRLEQGSEKNVKELAQGRTNTDGRVENLLKPDHTLQAGSYRLIFETGAYFEKSKIKSFYPSVQITFEVTSPGGGHYHVPLLLSPFGYSTYRGS